MFFTESSPQRGNAMERVITYIDGFNLYHGIHDSGWLDCLWLDIGALAKQIPRKG